MDNINTKSTKVLVLLIPWLIFLIGEVFYCSQYLLQVSVSPLSFSLKQSLHINAMTLATVAASYYYASIIFQLIGGILLDRYGIKKVLTASSLASTIGVFIFTYSDDANMLIAARILMGVGNAFSFIGAIKIARVWFDDRTFNFLNGATIAIGTLGAIAGTSLLGNLLEWMFWRYLLFYLSVFSLVITIFILFFVYEPSTKKIVTKFKPYFMNSIKPILLKKQLWIHGIYFGLIWLIIPAFAALWCIPFFEKVYQQHFDFTDSTPAFIFIGLAVGSILFSIIAHSAKRRILLLRSASICFLILSSVVYYTNLPETLMALSLFLAGFMLGSVTLVFINISYFLDKKIIATGISIIKALSSIFSGLFLPILGYVLNVEIHDQKGRHLTHLSVLEYRYIFLALTACALISVVLSFFIRAPNNEKE